MNTIFLLLGSNLGQREKYLDEAAKAIEKEIGNITKLSYIYESEPWGVSNQPAYLNQVVEVGTNLLPERLLLVIHQIEEKLGRERDKQEQQWHARTMDIDILLYGQEIYKSKTLEIPHAQLKNRRFVLVPLAEIAPQHLHPILNCTITNLLQECSDKGNVKKFML